MSIHEECGVFGVYSPKPGNVAALAYYGLYALQHRGQEASGIPYGTDIDSEEHLIASRHCVAEIAQMIGADSLGFLPREELGQLVGSEDYCGACFSGDYPTSIPKDTRKDQFEQRLSQRQADAQQSDRAYHRGGTGVCTEYTTKN